MTVCQRLLANTCSPVAQEGRCPSNAVPLCAPVAAGGGAGSRGGGVRFDAIRHQIRSMVRESSAKRVSALGARTDSWCCGDLADRRHARILDRNSDAV